MSLNTPRNLLNSLSLSEVGSRLLTSTFWSMAGGIIARGLAFLSFIIVARVLGKESLGVLAIIQSTAIMVSSFAAFGLSITASKHIAEFRTADPRRAGKILKLSSFVSISSGLFFSLILLIFSDWIAATILDKPEISDLLKISAVMMFFLALDGAQTGALIGFEAFKLTAKLNLYKGVLTFVALVIGVYVDGVRGATIGLVFGSVIGWFFNHRAVSRQVKKFNIPVSTFGECKSEIKMLWGFSLPSALSGVLIAPTIWVCSTMLVNQPSGYEQLGLYDVANRLYQMLIFIGVAIGAPLLPMLANEKTGSNESIKKLNVIITWMVGLIPVFPFIVFPEIIQWMFGEKYSGQDMLIVTTIMLVAACVVLYKQGLARALAANNLMWWGTLSNLFWAISMIVIASYLVSYGAIGLAITVLASYVLNTLVVIPLYISKNVVPKSTLISFESMVIWCLTLIPVYLIWNEYSIYSKLFYFLAAIFVICFCFYRLYFNAKDKNIA